MSSVDKTSSANSSTGSLNSLSNVQQSTNDIISTLSPTNNRDANWADTMFEQNTQVEKIIFKFVNLALFGLLYYIYYVNRCNLLPTIYLKLINFLFSYYFFVFTTILYVS